MIELVAEKKINCTSDEIKRWVKNLDKIYTLYCPDEHVKCKYKKGNPLKEGSLLYFEEYIASKKHKMKYRVQSVKNIEEIILKAVFPRSILNIRTIFHFKKIDKGIVFSRTIRLGSKRKIIGKLLDKLFFIVIGKDYYQEMIKHNEDDLMKLKHFIENNDIEDYDC